MLPSVLMTLNFRASVVGSNVVPGPYSVDAMQVYSPGDAASDIFTGHSQAAQAYNRFTQNAQTYNGFQQAPRGCNP